MQHWLAIAYKASLTEGLNRTEPDKTYYWGEARAFRDAQHHLKQVMYEVDSARLGREENWRFTGEEVAKALKQRQDEEDEYYKRTHEEG